MLHCYIHKYLYISHVTLPARYALQYKIAKANHTSLDQKFAVKLELIFLPKPGASDQAKKENYCLMDMSSKIRPENKCSHKTNTSELEKKRTHW